jgi:hypothetical protein
MVSVGGVGAFACPLPTVLDITISYVCTSLSVARHSTQNGLNFGYIRYEL